MCAFQEISARIGRITGHGIAANLRAHYPNWQMPMPNDSAATKGYKSAMMDMMKRMPKYAGDAYVDFMKQMKNHHQAAISMAKVVLANGKDAETKKMANEVISAQEKEIVAIDAWLKKKGA